MTNKKNTETTAINTKNMEIFDTDTRKLENAIVAGHKATGELLFSYVGRAIALANGSTATDLYRSDCIECGRFAMQENGKPYRTGIAMKNSNPTYAKTATVLNCLASMQSTLKLFITKNNACVFNTDWYLKNEAKEAAKEIAKAKEIARAEELLSGDVVEETPPTVLELIEELVNSVLENKKATKGDYKEALENILKEVNQD